MSSFGYLLSVARLNHLKTRHLRAALGLPSSVAGGLRNGQILWNVLARWQATRLGAFSSAANISRQPDEWSRLLPHYAGDRERRTPQLRGCRSCFRYGFHSLLHQLPWVALCPWHGEPLVETCPCGQLLLVPKVGRHALRLLDCPCGHDHFDPLLALSSPKGWLTDDVHCAHETYQREIDTFRGHGVRRHFLVDDQECNRALLEHTLPRIFVSQPRAAGCTFSASSLSLNEDEAEAIVESWLGSDAIGDFGGAGALVSKRSYQRIKHMAKLVNTEARRRHGMPRLLTISSDSIQLHGEPLVTSSGSLSGCSSIEAPLLVGARDKLMTTRLTSFQAGSAESAIAAEALNEIATLAALDHLEGLLHSKGALSGRPQYRVHRRFPVCQVRVRPKFQITVALAGVPRPASLL